MSGLEYCTTKIEGDGWGGGGVGVFFFFLSSVITGRGRNLMVCT